MSVASLLAISEKHTCANAKAANPANAESTEASKLAGLARLALARPQYSSDEWIDIVDELNGLCEPPGDPRAFDEPAMDRIRRTGVCQIWSQVIGEWLVWVSDDDARECLLSHGCRLPIYTLAELEIVKHWPPEEIKFAHEAKTLMGATIQLIPTEDNA